MRKLSLSLLLLLTCILSMAQVSESDRSLALELVKKNSSALGLSTYDIDNSIVTGTYVVPGSTIRMVYLQQSFKRIPVYNQLHVLAFRDEKLVSTAGSRVSSIETKVNSINGVPDIDPIKAIVTALNDIKAPTNDLIVPVNISNDGKKFEFGSLGISTENVFAELIWFPVEGGLSAKLAWQVFAAPRNSSAYWLVRVDALQNIVISKEDLTISCNWGPEGDQHDHMAHEKKYTGQYYVTAQKLQPNWQYKSFVVNTATYRVIKHPAESPIHPGGAPSLAIDPWLMSPGNATTLGWHNDGAIHYDSTRGNNVFAYDDRDANNLPGRSGLSSTPQPALTMDFVPNFSLEPVVRTPAPNQQFNTTNLFYWNNLLHDLSYLYGFTETARNYQNNNMGRGGTGNDYVLAEAQDGSGTNNANFSSGAEGTRGRMQMYLWTAPTPDRDGDVDNGIIAHEYAHGISNRMTGTGVGCLSVVEQMGEGWSDYIGLMITHDWSTALLNDGFDKPRGIGTYALNQAITGPGIRQYRYTTNMAVNPMTYANLPSVAVPHGVGTIWCTALWDMTWYIIQQNGTINPNIFNPDGGGGNAIALKLVIEGLRLQPCNPGFITGRNAILKADTLFFGAQYSCAILEAFARRGMGVGASQGSASIRGDETISFDNGKPAITTHPASVNICAGANHTFNVVATGVDLSYQWQLSTDGGATFNNIAGATTANYALTGITVSMNNYRYRCVVSGCPPAAMSNVATLTVADPPSVTTSPSDITVCEGANTSLTVVASGAGTLYQWQVSTNGGSTYNNITGATTATLTLNNITVGMNNNWYRCALTNAICTTPVFSAVAKLTVNANTAITQQPIGATLCLGAAHTLCVTVAGANLQYQWEAALSCAGPWTNISPNSSCITVTPIVTTYYRCRVFGNCGPAIITDCINITVINPITISQQPIDREICSGSNTSLTVTASSNETINYQWQLSTDGGSNWSNVTNSAIYSGATSATLNITGATVGMTGTRYRNQLNTAACASPVNTGTATLTVRQLPTVILTAAPLTSLLPGQITVLTATPSGSTGGIFSTTWFLNNTQVPNTGNTRQVNVEQVGNYRVSVQETFASGLTCSNQSEVVVIDAKASSKLFIFPSPNNGRFTVSYYNSNSGSTQRRILIYDAKGGLVYDRQFPITGPYTLIPIDLRAAQRGIYFVRVGDASGNVLAEGKVHVH
jgi:hypothetical protein